MIRRLITAAVPTLASTLLVSCFITAPFKKDPEPQPAVTHLRTLATSERPFPMSKYPTSRYALIEAKPETGRMHQIRRHLNGIAHPILGDGKHGDYRHNHYLRDHLSITRLLLHAHHLTLPHHSDMLTITAPLPDDFRAALTLLGLTFDEKPVAT